MTTLLSSPLSPEVRSISKARKFGRRHTQYFFGKLFLLAIAVLLAPMVIAQGAPRVTAIDPSSGKVNDKVTLTGENLGKDSVAAFFLSDDKSDFKATIVEQNADKTIITIPDVKPGDYNISMQVSTRILIGPVKFKVM